jgi:hypothetical protein
MKCFRIGPGRQVRHRIDLPPQLRDYVAGIGALAELIEFGKNAREGVFGLNDCELGVVLALFIEAPMMFDELFFEER